MHMETRTETITRITNSTTATKNTEYKGMTNL